MKVPENSTSSRAILLKGAREHNLKNIDVRIPRHQLVVVTGPSGSGKSSLAFDTLYAEGQRRYLESLSAYARQFLEQVPKPDVDRVEGLSPALAIEQKGLGNNPRSSVGTVTEILPFLRLLYARLGKLHCPDCGVGVSAGHPSMILEDLRSLPEGSRYLILAPLVEGRRGEHRKLLEKLQSSGIERVRVDGQVQLIGEMEPLARGKRHDIEAVIDRLVSGQGAPERLQRSVERALKDGGGSLRVAVLGGEERVYSDRLACPSCNRGFSELEPRTFSFNSPTGACPVCNGLGHSRQVSPRKVIPDPSLSIGEGGLAPLKGRSQSFVNEQVEYLVARLGGSLDESIENLSDKIRQALLEGTGGPQFADLLEVAQGHERFLADFEGLLGIIQRRSITTRSSRVREWCESFMEESTCTACAGSRLNPLARSVFIDGIDLGALCDLPLGEFLSRVQGWSFEGTGARIAEPLLKEILARGQFLVQAGVAYLSLARSVSTLSGGEGQRVRLATQVGSRLTGVLYVLDEPSIGLHARDTAQLIGLLEKLRDRGNSVVVVEHDRDIMESADWILDMGPGAGESGGRLVSEGTPGDIRTDPQSPTGQWLGRRPSFPQGPESPPAERFLSMRGIRARNLKNVDLEIPLNRLIAVTGVSGSGKSTAIHHVLYRALAARYHRAQKRPGEHDSIEGSENLQKVVLIDQRPIGRSPRSTPATFTDLMTHLRKVLSSTPAAKARGFGPGRFSFNTKGGRCEACAGVGIRTLSMDFLPEVQVVCDVCRGRRFNRQTLEIAYKGHSIADYLNMEVQDAHSYLENIPAMDRILSTLEAVGLGYLQLGQRGGTLSGGEAQRLKLARELSRPSQGETLYLLDEPTTGLHFQDVLLLLQVLRRLVDRGNTVVIIEHHPDVILAADHIIDIGPEGGREGGEIVVAGPVDKVVECAASHTGKMLRRHLDS